MEEFSISLPEYKILTKYQRRLEQYFDVVIYLPDINCGDFPASIITKIIGESRNITYTKNFLERKMNTQSTRKKCPAKALKFCGSTSVIILDDDDDDPKPQEISPLRKKNSGPPNSKCTSSSTARKNPASSSLSKGQRNLKSSPSNHQNADDSIIILSEASSSLCRDQSILQCSPSNHQNADDSIVILSEASSSCKGQGSLQSSPSNNQNADDSIVIVSEVIVSSTSVAVMGKNSPCVKKEIAPSSVNNSVAECNSQVSQPRPAFIPLRVSNRQPQPPKKSRKRKLEASAAPVAKERRVLRPIVIDGSNVARHHGHHSNTFSCKGIQISVDYFLQRGHTDIKVLLPHYRKYVTVGNVITTNPEYLDVLEARNMVVFTPSRKVNEKRITCYDDRFIVSLASQTNGVIVSNDQFRDILEENADFKKTITERLLMYCFAGDILMIPEDPLGPNGPTLDNFLSMKA